MEIYLFTQSSFNKVQEGASKVCITAQTLPRFWYVDAEKGAAQPMPNLCIECNCSTGGDGWCSLGTTIEGNLAIFWCSSTDKCSSCPLTKTGAAMYGVLPSTGGLILMADEVIIE